ncbi:CHASE2 domain-containing protein [Teredinibacter waterburyi]|uniref:CHASE2 domain-containing protein n=1 Tax=Teredinibacter waterburyi TaxID=1500538 RepID=UPI00165F1BA3|nr:CHASE2 domain-containing protein [Teredinibacter waterburyi]
MRQLSKLFSHLFIPLLLALLAATAQQRQWLEALDLLIYDTIQQHLPNPSKPTQTLIVAIDEQSIEQLGRWPWPRATHADLLQQLTDAKVSAVVFDILFSDPDKRSPENDILLQEAIEQNGKVVLPLYFEAINNKGQLLEIPPTPQLYQAAAAIGHAHVSCDSDGVCRSVFLKEGLGEPRWPHIGAALATLLNTQTALPGSRSPPEVEPSPMLLYRDYHNYIAFNASNRIPTLSYIDLLNGRFPPELLKDKIIFIGATAAGVHDVLTTPIGRIAGVEISAQIYSQLANHELIQRLASGIASVATGLVVLVLLSALSFLSPAQFLLSTLGSVILLIIATICSLQFGQLWIPAASSIIAVLVFYPLWSWLRLEIALNYLKRSIRFIEQSENTANYAALNHSLFSKPSSATALIGGSEVVSRTITQLFNANRELETTRQLLQQSINGLHEGMIVFSESGEIILFNQQAEVWFPHIRQNSDIVDLQDGFQLTAEYDWSALTRDLLANDSDFHLEAKCQNNTRQSDTVATIAELASENDEPETGEIQLFIQARRIGIERRSHTKRGTSYSAKVGVLTFIDITQLKESELARMETLNFISHDLRSPMVSILALIQSARKTKPEAQTGERAKLLADIEQYAQRNLSYAESLLQLSRAENSANESFQWCDLHAIIDDAHQQVMALAADKSISIDVHKQDADFWVNADFELLLRALINLLTNAIKYSPSYTKIHLSLNAAESLDSARPHALITVEDQGQGIANQDLPLLFQRFKRLPNNGDNPGAGLGLFFVKTVAQKLHGRLSVRSVVNEGTTFELALPLAGFEDELHN